MSREIPKILGHPILHRSSAGVADFNSPLRCDLVNTAWGHTQVTAEAASLFGLDQTHYENPDEDRAPRRVCHIAYGGICEAQELFAETMIVVERLHRNLGPKAAEVPLLVFKYRHGNGAESPVEHVEVPVLLGLSVSKPNILHVLLKYKRVGQRWFRIENGWAEAEVYLIEFRMSLKYQCVIISS